VGLPPALHPGYIVRPAEVVPVLGFVEPPLLTCGLTGFTAWGFGAVELAGSVSRVEPKQLFAMLALFLSDFLHHQHRTSWSRWCTTGEKNQENEERKYRKKTGRKYYRFDCFEENRWE
jgi:hypothetical protein